MTIRTLYFVAALYFLVLFGFITMPFGVKQINSVYPYIFGFPCFSFFILLFILLTLAGLIALYLMEGKILARDKNMKTGSQS